MSHSHPSGLLAAYNSLTDKHLAGYFNNTRIRRHLLRSGLITRSGRILSEKEYKLNTMKRDHQKYIRECLAQAIFHKVLDMERFHQLEIKKKLETLARKERIQRFKGEPIRWSIEKNTSVLSPHPPVGPKTNHGHNVLVEEGCSSPVTLTAPRPFTAPGIVQPPIRLQPLPSFPAAGAVPKLTSGSRSKTSPLENEAPFPVGGKKAVMKLKSSMDNSQGMNQYQLTNINSYMMPIPPPSPPPNGKIIRENRTQMWRRRRFRPITAPNSLEPVFTRDTRRINKAPLHSNAAVTMIYLGKNVHLSYDDPDFRDEIKVYQQHCGGENLCVYKGRLCEKETFQFISKRHHGFPFSLTFYLNGIQVNRLSSCCEYKHRKGSRIGGKRGYFGFVCVENSSPCYKCIIAMGLDKKPSSPKSKKQVSVEKREELKKGEGKLKKDRAYMKTRRSNMEGSRISASALFLAEEVKTRVEEVRTAVEETNRRGKRRVWRDDRENIYKYEYEEDFELDEEKQEEKANKGQADDQMSRMSKSPSDDEKDNLDPEKESETSSQKAPEAGDNLKDEDDGCSETESEEDKQDVKTASLSSSRSCLYSSCSDDESELGDGEAHAENSPALSVRSLSSQESSENDEPGKSHLPSKDSLKTEDQKIIKAHVETRPPPVEESLEDILEEETEKGAHMLSEGLSEKLGKYISMEEKEKSVRELWRGSTAKVKDNKAGPSRVERGVGQVFTGAVEPGCHSPCTAQSAASGADEGEKCLPKLEPDTGAASSRNLAVEESAALSAHKESKPTKEGAVEEDEVPQHKDADTTEEKRDAALRGKAGINRVPCGERQPPAAQPALAEPFTKEGGIPQGTAGGAVVEEDDELNEEELNPVLGEARASGGPNEAEASEKQAWTGTAAGTEKAACREDPGSERAVSASEAAAPGWESVQEVAAPGGEAELQQERGAEMGPAASQAGSEKPTLEDSEEAPEDLLSLGPEEDAASRKEGGLREAVPRGEEPGNTRRAERRAGTPPSGPAETAPARVLEESPEELGKEEEDREAVETAVACSKEDEREGALPRDLDAEGKRAKTPLGQTESEREEATGANALEDEGTSGEQKFKGQEGHTGKGLGPENGTPGTQNETERCVENETPTEASELTEDTARPEDSLRQKEAAVLGTTPGLEKSRGNVAAVRKEGGGGRLGESGDRTLGGHVELLRGDKDGDAAALLAQEGRGREGEGAPGAGESGPAGQTLTATGQAHECAANSQDDLAGLERKEKDGSSQEEQEVGATALTQEDVSEGDPTMAATCGGVMDEDAKEAAGPGCALTAAAMPTGHAEGGDGVLQEGPVTAGEDLQQEGAAEMAEEETELLAASETAEGEREAHVASSSFSDVTGEETWHKMCELVGKTAAAEQEAAEKTAPNGEETPAGEGVAAIEAPEAQAKAPEAASPLAGTAPRPEQDRRQGDTGQEAGLGGRGGAQESGEAEELRLGSSLETETEAERSGESLPGVEVLPADADWPETREKPEEQAAQRERENQTFP